jgi:hypothetical protein
MGKGVVGEIDVDSLSFVGVAVLHFRVWGGGDRAGFLERFCRSLEES